MHSGTHLLRALILRCGPQGRDAHSLHVNEIDYNTGDIGWPDNFKNNLVIAPLRHPSRMLASFESRELEYNEFKQQWDEFIERVHPFVNQYLHIDMPIVRDQEVAKIGKLLDCEIVPDWSVNIKSGSMRGNHSRAINECPKAPKEYINFYYKTSDVSQ